MRASSSVSLRGVRTGAGASSMDVTASAPARAGNRAGGIRGDYLERVPGGISANARLRLRQHEHFDARWRGLRVEDLLGRLLEILGLRVGDVGEGLRVSI